MHHVAYKMYGAKPPGSNGNWDGQVWENVYTYYQCRKSIRLSPLIPLFQMSYSCHKGNQNSINRLLVMVTYLFAKELGWEKHHLPVFNKIIKSKYSGKIFECLIFVVDINGLAKSFRCVKIEIWLIDSLCNINGLKHKCKFIYPGKL